MMALRIRSKKIAQKARVSAENKAVLQRLENYLNSNSEKPVKFLISFWKDQGTSFTYKELRETIIAGEMSSEELEAWQQDYSKLVADKMRPMWLEAISNGISGQPIFDEIPKGFQVDTGIRNVVDWITDRGAQFVTSSTEEQKKAIQAMLLKKTTDKYSVDELARVIRPCIGLTEGQAKANLRYYENLKETLARDHPRMKKESIEKKAREAQIKYAAKQHRERAYTIAHTEMAFAFAKGADAGIRQAQSEGLIGVCQKEWITSGTDRVCQRCNSLNGVKLDMDEEFDIPGKNLFQGYKLTPPAHPRCMCAVKYVEVD